MERTKKSNRTHSKQDNERSSDRQPSFISDARRTQIFNAVVTTLDDIGYVNASLAQVAKRANISTSLISYHFEDKLDLMNYTLTTLLLSKTTYVLEKIDSKKSCRDNLHEFIRASLNYQAIYPKHSIALIEIVFNARMPDNTPYYKLPDEGDDPLITELTNLLTRGQKTREFRTFHVPIMASAVQGAIGEYMLNPHAYPDVEFYSKELIEIFDMATRKIISH
jgi:TetR/AcrR family transcriptional regulator, transcriptional repressor of bet genes